MRFLKEVRVESLSQKPDFDFARREHRAIFLKKLRGARPVVDFFERLAKRAFQKNQQQI
jgi:hypothetical protein